MTQPSATANPTATAKPTATASRHDGEPDPDARVVLDIGADVGALVLYAPKDLAGAEVEVSIATDPGAARTHAIVRERRIRPCASTSSSVFAAVYPGLPAGTYTIWRDASAPAGTVQVTGGAVATWRWEAD